MTANDALASRFCDGDPFRSSTSGAAIVGTKEDRGFCSDPDSVCVPMRRPLRSDLESSAGSFFIFSLGAAGTVKSAGYTIV